MRKVIQGISISLGAMAAASAASAATLVHAYEFDAASTASIVDSVGAANGTLVNGATVSGGALHLDGAGDYAQISGKIIPTDGSAYSLYVRYAGGSQGYYYEEIVSQGYSGGPGFYLGYVGGAVRLTDHFGGGVSSLPLDNLFHDLLVTTSSAEGTSLYIDGTLAFSTGTYLSVGAGGDDTRFGTQFGGYSEYFKGDLDAVRVFSGVASYREASVTSSAAPEPASWLMMVGGFGLLGAAMRRNRATVRFAA